MFAVWLGQATILDVKRLAKRAEKHLRRPAVKVAHGTVVGQYLHLIVREEYSQKKIAASAAGSSLGHPRCRGAAVMPVGDV